MADEPRDWIDRLWSKLGMQRQSSDARDLLDVDGIAVRIFASDSERALLVEADGGMLPVDSVGRSRAVKRLLSVNLGMLTSNRAGTYLNDAGSGRTAVTVQGVWTLGQGGIDGLIAVIDDVVYRAEFHRRDLDSEAAPRVLATVSAGSEDFEERFIFRP